MYYRTFLKSIFLKNNQCLMILLHWACTLLSIASKYAISTLHIKCITTWLLEICTLEYECTSVFIFVNSPVGGVKKIQEYLMINMVFFSFYKDLRLYFYIILLIWNLQNTPKQLGYNKITFYHFCQLLFFKPFYF